MGKAAKVIVRQVPRVVYTIVTTWVDAPCSCAAEGLNLPSVDESVTSPGFMSWSRMQRTPSICELPTKGAWDMVPGVAPTEGKTAAASDDIPAGKPGCGWPPVV